MNRQRRLRRTAALLTAAVATVAVLQGCTRLVGGTGTQATVAGADLPVAGDSHGAFDTQVKNALSDVLQFWEATYPKLTGGKSFPPLQGKFYSVDGLTVLKSGKAPAAVAGEKCLAKQLDFIVDNAAYCELDDSVIWDRSPQHLLPVLERTYGPAVVALVFAHEIGHALQARLGTVGDQTPTIDAESQADCAAGAFAAYALAGKAPHFRLTGASINAALDGYLLVRDSTPESPEDISHGNGFDRLSALQDGIDKGAAYCYSSGYFASRNFTERGFSDADRANGGNQTLAQVLDPDDPTKDDQAGGLEFDLNRFWAAAGKSISQTFIPVKFAEADHPKCGAADAASEFGYCPTDNTVYYSQNFAMQAYYSITELVADPHTANITLQGGQPGDFALGELISVGWGMAAQSQFFRASTTTQKALIAAVCYSGAYAANINIADTSKAHPFVLSAPDMDEATSSVLDQVGSAAGFGPRNTSGLDRVKAFLTGYTSGLGAC
ncbi:hypothetical protein [Jatrophihabitans sp.]|uniref:hypothetical protein n=1 Tax=Jatrophihabitans sp. TaxID=1932789 RepID=UPI0030C736F6|nr:putative metalloprotease [Jatrophihabitans sp.]